MARVNSRSASSIPPNSGSAPPATLIVEPRFSRVFTSAPAAVPHGGTGQELNGVSVGDTFADAEYRVVTRRFRCVQTNSCTNIAAYSYDRGTSACHLGDQSHLLQRCHPACGD